MTPNQIVALALRLFAIWIGLNTLGYVPSFFLPGFQHPSAYEYTTFLLALNVVIILALWFFPRLIAGNLLPAEEPQSQTSATAETWLAIGCTLIGLWTLSTAIPKLAFYIYLSSADEARWRNVPQVVYEIVQLAIAIWLVLGGKGVGKIFRWVQYAGIRKDL